MKRNTHTFQYTSQDIARAADEEWQYHQGRVIFWEREQATAIQAARDSGLEMREHAVTGGVRVEAVIDPILVARLSECAGKLAAHKASADRYKIEAAAYKGQDKWYELDADDVVYFRLEGGPRAE